MGSIESAREEGEGVGRLLEPLMSSGDRLDKRMRSDWFMMRIRELYCEVEEI